MWGSRREFFRPFFCPSRKEWIKFSIAFEGDRKVGARNQLKLDGLDLQVGWGTWLVTPGHATAVLYYSGNTEIQMTIQRSPSWAINHNFLQLEKEYKKYIKKQYIRLWNMNSLCRIFQILSNNEIIQKDDSNKCIQPYWPNATTTQSVWYDRCEPLTCTCPIYISKHTAYCPISINIKTFSLSHFFHSPTFSLSPHFHLVNFFTPPTFSLSPLFHWAHLLNPSSDPIWHPIWHSMWHPIWQLIWQLIWQFHWAWLSIKQLKTQKAICRIGLGHWRSAP